MSLRSEWNQTPQKSLRLLESGSLSLLFVKSGFMLYKSTFGGIRLFEHNVCLDKLNPSSLRFIRSVNPASLCRTGKYSIIPSGSLLRGHA